MLDLLTTIGADLSSDFYDDLPTGRNYTAVASVTPGAQADDSGQTFYGSTGSENAYYIDGANTTSIEFGQQGTQLNFEFIDEVQVKTGSYSGFVGTSGAWTQVASVCVSYFPKIRQAFCPPRPKELVRATSTFCLRAWFGT